jgi:translation initiation factor 1
MSKNSRLVYSSDQGRIKPITEPSSKAKAPSDGVIRIQRETKGRNGKGVTVIRGCDMNDEQLKALSKQLKQLCGTGGTVKEGNIEIQGDQRQKLLQYLLDKGFTAKIAGG